METATQFNAAVEEAVALLRRGEVVALPTETVYGLAANALEARAVGKIFEVKGRPAHNPVIVHVSSLPMAYECVAEWGAEAERLAREYWPGPLTIVLSRNDRIPDAVTAGGKTVGVRWPLHPFMRRVIEQCGFPLAAPSANLSNRISPTTAEHVLQGLQSRIPLVINAGPTSVGIESTVVDLSHEPARVLRPGMISAEQLSKTLGRRVGLEANHSGELKSPGLLKKHYSPRAKVVLAEWGDSKELARIAEKSGVASAAVHVLAYERIPEANPFGRVAIIPHDAEAYARALYAELHRSDELGAKLILVEQPPAGPDWIGIRDRLRRASAES
ncbi:MAG TPA: L-threonylcarbamoyladenylate synthase [Verrucomicrobiae bacterium]